MTEYQETTTEDRLDVASSGDEPAFAEFCIAVNELGDSAVGSDAEYATEQLRDSFGGDECRIIRIRLDITAAVPRPVEVEAVLPKREDGHFTLQIKS